MREGIIGLIESPSAAAVPSQIAEEIDRLRAQGVDPSDIAVLSLRGRGAKNGIVHLDRIGRHRVVPADDPEMGDHVVCDTFLRFKGLERPVIIVTDVDGVDEGERGVRMHIALTRALDVVRIVSRA